MPAIIHLNKFADCFKDDGAMKRFAALLSKAASGRDLSFVFDGTEFCCVVLPVEAAQERLTLQILRRLQDKPEILSELQDRLDSDDIVE